MPISERDAALLVFIRQGVAVLTLLGNLVIVVAIFITGANRNFSARLILWLSVSSGIFAISWLLPEDTFAECLAQSVITSFGALAELSWTAAICFNTFQVAVKNNLRTEEWEARYHFLCWMWALALSAAPLFTGLNDFSDTVVYGHSGACAGSRGNTRCGKRCAFTRL